MKGALKDFVCLHDDQNVTSGLLMRSWEERKTRN